MHVPRNYLEKSRKFLKRKLLHSTQDLLTELLNFIHFGLLRIIENLMGCLYQMDFFLIMKVKEEDIHLLLGKLR